MENEQCPVCGYYCLGKGGIGCIDKPSLCGIDMNEAKVEELEATITRLKRYECSWTDCGAQKKNKELQAKVEKLEEAARWIPVESAPKDGTEILMGRYNKAFNQWDFGVVKWCDGTWAVRPTRDGRLSLLGTHWKPIKPPENRGKG